MCNFVKQNVVCWFRSYSKIFYSSTMHLIMVMKSVFSFLPSFFSTIFLAKGKISKSVSLFLRHFFSIWVFFYKHSRITGLQGKGEGISLTPHYHFHPFHRHLDISRVITAESSLLHIASSRTWAGNLWLLSASR